MTEKGFNNLEIKLKKDSDTKIDKLAQMTEKGFNNLEIKLKKDSDTKIDKLAQMTAHGFLKVDERFERVEDTITDLKITVDKRLNSMEEKMEKSMDKMQTIADGMAIQFSNWKQENAFGAGIESRQDEQLKDHEKRIIKVEQKLEV